MKNFICDSPAIAFGLGLPVVLVLMGVAFMGVSVLAMQVKRQM